MRRFCFHLPFQKSRRNFLKYSTASGIALGTAGMLEGCFSSHDNSTSEIREQRRYYFVFNTETDRKYYLWSPGKEIPLAQLEEDEIERSDNLLIREVGKRNTIHYVDTDFPGNEIRLYQIRTDDSSREGGWKLILSFLHIPKVSFETLEDRYGTGENFTQKLAFFGLDDSIFAGVAQQDTDPLMQIDTLKSYFDMAADMTFSHPEILSLDKDAAAYVHSRILGTQPRVKELAFVLQSQGPATESGGWATLEPYINPDTHQPYLNSKGKVQYFIRYSEQTRSYLGSSILPSVAQVKNDTALGASFNDLDPAEENSVLKGKLWSIYDGIPTVELQDDSSTEDKTLRYTCTNKSRRHGYKATMIGAGDDGYVTFKTENWYLRYLSLYLVFYDADGREIPVDKLPQKTLDSFPAYTREYDTEVAKFIDILSSEFVILGIPVKHATKEIRFYWPENASSAYIVAGGIGNGRELYSGTSGPGAACTALIDYVVPVIFLVAGAATSYVSFAGQYTTFEKAELAEMITDVMTELIVFLDAVAQDHADGETFIDAAKTVGEFLLKKGASYFFIQAMDRAIEEGEALDSVPLIGKILSAISTIGIVAELTESLVETRQSPTNYSDKITATHDLTVIIKPDPEDAQGFPSSSSYYLITAIFDDGTPYSSGRLPMPHLPRTDPITYTFPNVPYGGNVKVCVGFYSSDGWQAGKGCTDTVPNNTDIQEITIQEEKVPISATTRYLHHAKLMLDQEENLSWYETDEAPTPKHDSLSCSDIPGSLCRVETITVSEAKGTLGFSWRSYSQGLTECGTGGEGQYDQFATAGMGGDPESSRCNPICGFPLPPRPIFDLMGTSQNNFYLDTSSDVHHIRQIQLTEDEPPIIDGPDSNRSWGYFNLPSDALLLHPSRKLISLNTAAGKVEVLTLPIQAVADDHAPKAVAYSGEGDRIGLVRQPVCACIAPQGVILILESGNARVQAFDTGLNPVPYFGPKTYAFSLLEENDTITYVDMAIEYTGYIYILSYDSDNTYRLDVYSKTGKFITRTTGVNAGALCVDFWRNVYTLNYELMKLPDGSLPSITQPSVSEWIPTPP